MANKTLQIRDKTIFDGIFTKYVLKGLFYLWFKLAGWKVTPSTPEGAGVAIAAPHTSNWDFIYALGAAILQDIKIYFSIKESWCKIPIIGSIMMWMGAMPIDRSSNGRGQVELIKDFVKRHKNSRVFFLFTPEGTRSKVSKWKTGFYHVAQGCEIPIFLAKVDYQKKESGVFHTFQLSNDKANDIQAIQASYKTIYGKHPQDQFPEYTAPMPKISDMEAKIMRALYSFKDMASVVDISAKAKLGKLSNAMLKLLEEKGVIETKEQVSSRDKKLMEVQYRLTFAGKGCLLHLYPSLMAR